MPSPPDNELLATIRRVCVKIRKWRPEGLGEQDTKTALIQPVLRALGWDVEDPDEVKHEFRPTGQDSPVDYALQLRHKPRLLLEAKGLGESLSDRRRLAQVLTYAVMANVKWCVLTDGDEYRFLNLSPDTLPEEMMFCSVKLGDGQDHHAARILNLISRRNLEQNLIDTFWESQHVDRRVRAALGELFESPAKSIVRLVRSRVPRLKAPQILDSIRRLGVNFDSPPTTMETSSGATPGGPTQDKRGRATRSRKRPDGAQTISLRSIIEAGHLPTPTRLTARYRGRELEAAVLPDGDVEYQGRRYNSCSTAAEMAKATVTGKRRNTNGWMFWRYVGADGKGHLLDEARRALPNGQAADRVKKSLYPRTRVPRPE